MRIASDFAGDPEDYIEFVLEHLNAKRTPGTPLITRQDLEEAVEEALYRHESMEREA